MVGRAPAAGAQEERAEALVPLGLEKQQRERRTLVSASSRKNLRVSNKWEEPLRKVKRTVEESLETTETTRKTFDLETTAATSKSLVEFLENVQKTEFFANM